METQSVMVMVMVMGTQSGLAAVMGTQSGWAEFEGMKRNLRAVKP